jgi:hypothetical protein
MLVLVPNADALAHDCEIDYRILFQPHKHSVVGHKTVFALVGGEDKRFDFALTEDVDTHSFGSCAQRRKRQQKNQNQISISH